MDQKVKEIMKALDCTEAEALEVIAMDDEIDHGADPFKLTPEQEKVSKAARSVDRKPAAQKAKRERKADQTKRDLVECIRQALLDGGFVAHENGEVLMTVTNVERQLDFVCGDRKFRVVLSAPRK